MGGCTLLPEAAKRSIDFSLKTHHQRNSFERQVGLEAWFVRPSFCFVIEWRDLWPEDFLKQLAFLLLHDLTRPLGDLDRYPWKRKTWEIQHEQMQENLGWVVVEQQILNCLLSRGKWLPIWLAQIVQTDGRKPPTLKSRFTQKVKKKESFPKVAQVVTWWFLACCWNLHPFFQNYKKSWPSSSTITKRIPRNWQTMNSSNSQKASYNWIISLSTIHF